MTHQHLIECLTAIVGILGTKVEPFALDIIQRSIQIVLFILNCQCDDIEGMITQHLSNNLLDYSEYMSKS